MEVPMRSVALFFALLFVLASSLSFANPLDHTCGTETIYGISFKYCMNHVDRQQTRDIVYFFHGLQGNAESWFTRTEGATVANYWSRNGYEPTVVTVSFGGAWLLVNNDRFPLLPFFKNQMMPFLEQQVGGLKDGRRLLIGASMGGFNASQASLQLPGDFKKVALLCPAITTIGPYSSPQEVAAYIKRTGANPVYVRLTLGISKKIFEDEADWENHNPLNLLKRYPATAEKPAFFVSVGMKDDFGFQEGSEAFAKEAQLNSYITQWVPVAGGHCQFDVIATADFIMED
jgi:pimeloyl-ACP methyl ester carboxylesterase